MHFDLVQLSFDIIKIGRASFLLSSFLPPYFCALAKLLSDTWHPHVHPLHEGGMIFFKRGPVLGVDLESAINNAVFPGLQGGPHNHTIGGLAVCLKYAQSPEFRGYQSKVVSNCRALASRLIELGYKLVSGGSDNHLVLVDLRPLDIDGARVEKVLDMASITLNKNSVPGFKEKEFIATADFIHEGVQIALEAKRSVSGSKLQDFMKFVGSPDSSLTDRVSDLRTRVEALTTQFPMPGL
ncbi:Serine hydroxymethyltransferase 3, chloroplastic [Sarracenia purpurea var. burkii]